jgi:hypothetical protein
MCLCVISRLHTYALVALFLPDKCVRRKKPKILLLFYRNSGLGIREFELSLILLPPERRKCTYISISEVQNSVMTSNSSVSLEFEL